MGLTTILVTQARLGSTRLPGKVLKTIDNKSLLQIHLERLKRCTKINQIMVATTTNSLDEIIYNSAIDWGFKVYRGSEDNVLDRFYQAVKDYAPDWVVRVTSDCPLLDPKLVDEVITFAQKQDCDYVSNGLIEHFPDGQDVEVFKFSALALAWKNAKLKSELEHVTPYIRNNANGNREGLFTIQNYPCREDYSTIRMTVDEPEDFELIRYLIQKLGTDKTWLEYSNYMIDNDLTEMNSRIIRNEGLLKSLKNDKNG
jgi:spore coat polysaccharide biosynthesis protein SpsF (cytidylyltransferase family)